MLIFTVLGVWAAIGLLVGVYEARRGHWSGLWLLGAMAGPFVVPLARQLQQNEVMTRRIPLSEGTPGAAGGLRVLAGVDGSREAVAGAVHMARVLSARTTAFDLAIVVDYEAELAAEGAFAPPEPWDAAARRAVAEAADEVERASGRRPGTMLLAGHPATALQRCAVAEGYDLLVVASRGRGLSKRFLGSCASELARESAVPVVIAPATDRAAKPTVPG